MPKHQAMEPKELHDRLLASLPEGIEHKPEECPLCTIGAEMASLTQSDTTPGGGDMSDKTYSQEDLDTAVASAVEEATKPLEDKIKDLSTTQEEAAIEGRISEVREELATKVAELQTELDKAQAEAGEARQAREDLESYLETAQAEVEALEELAKVKEERLAIVQEHANFTDEYLEANGDRWATMGEEDFASLVEDWKAISSASSKEGSGEETPVPSATAMIASRSTEATTKQSDMGPVREVLDLGTRPTDLANL